MVTSAEPLNETEPSTTPSTVIVLAVLRISALEALPKKPAAAPTPLAAVI